MEKRKIQDTVKLGSYEVVEGLDLATITRNDSDKGQRLDGLLLYGYETKFANNTNENGERYTRECLDDFVNRYFVEKGLNMPLTIQHDNRPEYLAGRVLVLEVNTVGFYFVCYIPKHYVNYPMVLNLVRDGVLQGLSKEGWCTEGECHYKEDGTFDYYEVKQMELLCVSLVATPANGVALESVKEIENKIKFENKTVVEEGVKNSEIDELFV